jgi:multicomponent Na+:H+ antiporter subunit D
MSLALPLAVAIPLLVAAICATVASAGARRALAFAAVASTGAIGVAGLVATADGEVVVAHVGGFPAPFAIPLVADAFSSLMLVVFAVAAACCLGFAALRNEDEAPRYHAAGLALVGAAAGATLTADLFNLFVWIEVLLLASYVLLTIGSTGDRVRAGAVYVATNFLGSTVFLAGVGLVYATAGSVNLGSLQGAAIGSDAVAVGATLILVALAVKAGLVPVHAWLPRAYPVAPAGVTALFSGTLTKVGVVAMYRVVWVLFDGGGSIATPILIVAGVTMVVGVVGAVGRTSMRGILSFHMVSQMGYLVMALGLRSAGAIAAGVFFLAQYIGVKTGLFLSAGAVEAGEGSDELTRLGGVARRRPWLAAVFLVSALSLAGIPPFSGFVAKLALVRAAFEERGYVIAAVAVVVSLFTLLSMVKIWNGVFWGEPRTIEDAETPPEAARSRRATAVLAPAAFLAVVTLVLGLGAEGLWVLADRAARGLLDVAAYAGAVTGS